MYLEEGTIYRVNCEEKMKEGQFAETLLLLVNQKSSNRTSGILDVETIYGTNDILVTVRDSVCEYKMKDYLSTFGEVTTESIILGTSSHDEQRYSLERNELSVDNLDKDEARKFIEKLKGKEFISYKGFIVED